MTLITHRTPKVFPEFRKELVYSPELLFKDWSFEDFVVFARHSLWVLEEDILPSTGSRRLPYNPGWVKKDMLDDWVLRTDYPGMPGDVPFDNRAPFLRIRFEPGVNNSVLFPYIIDVTQDGITVKDYGISSMIGGYTCLVGRASEVKNLSFGQALLIEGYSGIVNNGWGISPPPVILSDVEKAELSDPSLPFDVVNDIFLGLSEKKKGSNTLIKGVEEGSFRESVIQLAKLVHIQGIGD